MNSTNLDLLHLFFIGNLGISPKYLNGQRPVFLAMKTKYTCLFFLLSICLYSISAQNPYADVDSIGIQNLIAQGCPNPDFGLVPLAKQATALNMTSFKIRIGYPAIAKAASIEPGTIRFKVLVDENGTYLAHYFVKQPHRVWKDELNKHIYTLRFSPAIDKQGKKVVSWLLIPLHIDVR